MHDPGLTIEFPSRIPIAIRNCIHRKKVRLFPKCFVCHLISECLGTVRDFSNRTQTIRMIIAYRRRALLEDEVISATTINVLNISQARDALGDDVFVVIEEGPLNPAHSLRDPAPEHVIVIVGYGCCPI